MQKFKLNSKKVLISALMILVVFGAVISVKPANAQFADPVVGANTTFKNIFDGLQDIWASVKDGVLNAAAVSFRQAGAAVLNTIAAETAKAIATGDWGAPVFSFDKGFYSALADGVAGDLITDFVSGTTGGAIDLCNFDPKFTFKSSLGIPFFDDYKYEPRCSISQISENLQNIKLDEILDVQITLTEKRVESVNDAITGIGGDSEGATTNVGSGIVALLRRFTNADPSQGAARNTRSNDKTPSIFDRMKEDGENIKTIVAAGSNVDQDEEASKIKAQYSSSEVKKKESEYKCWISALAQQYNFALIGTGFSSSYGATSPCEGLDGYKMDESQWISKWLEGAEAWVTSKSQLSGRLVSEMSRISGDELSKAMDRARYPYDLCADSLSKALDFKIVANEKIPAGNFTTPPLKQIDGDQVEGVFAAEIIDPNTFGTEIRKITYRAGKELTTLEFTACQVAFNGGKLLGNGEKGANIFEADDIVSRTRRLLGDSVLGSSTDVFDVGKTRDEVTNFIKTTIVDQLSGDKAASVANKSLLKSIGTAVKHHLVAKETVLSYLSDILTLLNVDLSQFEEISNQNDRIDAFGDSLSGASNENATIFKLNEAVIKAQEEKRQQEETFALEKGSLANPDTSPVSDLAKNLPEQKNYRD